MRVSLRVASGKSVGKELVVPHQEFLIGRSDACHLRPKSDAVSRKHCRLLVEEDAVYIEDLGSRNGTYVNGEKITERHRLQSGDVLRIAKLEFEVVIDRGVKTETPPVEIDEVGSNKEETWADEEITRWLEEGGPAETENNRHLRLDPQERSLVDTALNRGVTETTIVSPVKEDAVAKTAEKTDQAASSESKPDLKKPGKLPPRPVVQAPTSGEAAAQMLKKFFTRP